MVAKKSNSKRLTLRTKYKIKHKVKEHKKKIKKLHRKNPHLANHLKSKRDPGIPNHWPFKNELLEQIEKHRLEEEQKRKLQSELAKRKRKKELELKKNSGSLLNSSQTSSLLSSSSFTTSDSNTSSSSITLQDRQTLRSLHDLIDVSDLILFCLDARDPLGSRCPIIEKRIVSASKSTPMIFVLTHADCIPPSVLASWLRYLNVEAPTIAFHETPAVRALKPHVTSVAGVEVTHEHNHSAAKLNPQRKQNTVNSALSRRKLDKGAFLKVDEIGSSAVALIEFLQNFRLMSDSGINDKPLQVSVLGFGNVGKSTLINALCRLHAVTVSPNGGFTKSIRKAKMTKQVALFDTPAIPSISIHPGPHITLPLDRAEQTIAALLDALDPTMVTRVLSIPEYKDANECLHHLAIKKAKYSKGGQINVMSATRAFVREWNDGTLPYYTYPPANTPAVDPLTEDAKDGDGFSLSMHFAKANETTLNTLTSVNSRSNDSYFVLDDSLFLPQQEDDEEVEEDEDENMESVDEDDESEQDESDDDMETIVDEIIESDAEEDDDEYVPEAKKSSSKALSPEVDEEPDSPSKHTRSRESLINLKPSQVPHIENPMRRRSTRIARK